MFPWLVTVHPVVGGIDSRGTSSKLYISQCSFWVPQSCSSVWLPQAGKEGTHLRPSGQSRVDSAMCQGETLLWAHVCHLHRLTWWIQEDISDSSSSGRWTGTGAFSEDEGASFKIHQKSPVSPTAPSVWEVVQDLSHLATHLWPQQVPAQEFNHRIEQLISKLGLWSRLFYMNINCLKCAARKYMTA